MNKAFKPTLSFLWKSGKSLRYKSAAVNWFSSSNRGTIESRAKESEPVLEELNQFSWIVKLL